VISLAKTLLQPVLHSMDPEQAHGLSILALRMMPPLSFGVEDQRLNVNVCGLSFPNPLGMAAGYDKGAEVPDALLRLGFGFVEVGTITPLPQPGNPKPRLFRLPADEGVINRLGFNSEGHVMPHQRLVARGKKPGIVGVNVGANKESSDRTGDYVSGIRAFADVADYFTCNISSPNTPGLRDLQQAAALDDLLARVLAARDEAIAAYGYKPVFLKIAPDLTPGDLDDIVRVARNRRIDALILGNTTVTRPATLHEQATAREAGGLSGKPLFDLSTKMLAAAYLRVGGQFPVIGAGGIDGPESAFAKMEAGATLVQLYSSMVFKGPTLPGDILRGLVQACDAEKLATITDIVGRRAQEWAGDFA
jgi:dihydroorotate dehydrogenase